MRPGAPAYASSSSSNPKGDGPGDDVGQALLQAAMDRSQAGIAIADAPDGRLRYVNQAGLFIRGGSEAEVVAQVDAARYVESWHILHHDGAPYALDEVPLARAVLYGETSEAEFIIRRDDQEDRIVLARAAPIRDDAGTVTAGVVVFHDVTERVIAEREVRESESRFRQLAESLPQLVWTCPPDGPCDFLSSQWVAYTGIPEALQLGFGWLDQLHPDDREPTVAAWEAAVGAGTDFHVEFRIRRHDGEYRWFDTQALRLRDADGNTVKWFGSNTDITERREAAQEILRLNAELEERVVSRTAQLDAANKELVEFVYSAAHDLRAPLRAIDGFSQMIADDAAQRLDENDAAHLQRVRAAAQRVAGLIDHLMALSLASRRDLEIAEVDVSALASSVFEEMRAVEPGRDVEIAVAPGMRADADEVCLRSILANLIGNALKFTSRHETARIEVGVAEAGGERAFFVRDDGSGFDREAAEHLFGAFQRYHDPAEFEGDGVGLATVKRLVVRHGGRVWAEGEVEEGATFYFTLPRNGAQSA